MTEIIEEGKKRHCLCNAKKKGNQKKTPAFKLYIILILYMFLFFYANKLIGRDIESGYGVLTVIINAVLFLYLIIGLVFNRYVNRTTVFLICLFVVLSGISFLVNRSGLEKLFGLACFLTIIVAGQVQSMTNNERRIAYYLFIIVVIVVLLNGNTLETVHETNKFNPNICGQLLTLLFCVSFVKFRADKKFDGLFFCILSTVLQFVYKSRTALMGEAIFLVLYMFAKFVKMKNRKLLFLFTFLISVGGVLFAYLYSEVLFPKLGYGKIIIFGKDLFTGRQWIWHYTFEFIKRNIFFGGGSYVNNDLVANGFDNVVTNVHSQSLGILSAFGILPFIVFYVAFSYAISEPYKRKQFDLAPVLFMITISIMTYFEIYLFTQYYWLSIVVAYTLISNFKNSPHLHCRQKLMQRKVR